LTTTVPALTNSHTMMEIWWAKLTLTAGYKSNLRHCGNQRLMQMSTTN